MKLIQKKTITSLFKYTAIFSLLFSVIHPPSSFADKSSKKNGLCYRSHDDSQLLCTRKSGNEINTAVLINCATKEVTLFQADQIENRETYSAEILTPLVQKVDGLLATSQENTARKLILTRNHFDSEYINLRSLNSNEKAVSFHLIRTRWISASNEFTAELLSEESAKSGNDYTLFNKWNNDDSGIIEIHSMSPVQLDVNRRIENLALVLETWVIFKFHKTILFLPAKADGDTGRLNKNEEYRTTEHKVPDINQYWELTPGNN